MKKVLTSLGTKFSAIAVLGTVGALATANIAKADVITINAAGSPVISATGSTWTYSAQLTATESLNNATGAQFLTVYSFDFGSDAATISNITGLLATDFSSSLLAEPGVTEAFNQGFAQPACGSNCDAIRFTFTGATPIMTTGTPIDLGTFTVTSSYVNIDPLSYYDGQATNNTNGFKDGNSGFIAVPTAVPEPMSLGLFGGGLALLGIARLRRSGKGANN